MVLRFSLKATADDGFALRVTRDAVGISEEERELEHLMTKVLEACPTCLTMARIGDGQILYRSPEATALLGKGFNSREHFALRDERADFITELLPNSRVDDMRITARRIDGTPFPASIFDKTQTDCDTGLSQSSDPSCAHSMHKITPRSHESYSS